jgi:DmsE family decaheme c-type cytochrome
MRDSMNLPNDSRVRRSETQRSSKRDAVPQAILAALALFLFAAQPATSAPHNPKNEVCAACHEDIAKAFESNVHKQKSCEVCHGPTEKHQESASAADIRQPAKLRASEVDKTCLACHLNQPAHAGRIQSGHGKNQVSCVACHTAHAKGTNIRVKASVNGLCTQCHVTQKAEFSKSHHHKVPEGAMSCVDCHNPHGKSVAKDQTCTNCHGDKRGPFTFEHAPVRLEGCTACHVPHGSANPKMLTRHEVRNVCLECHANIGTQNNTLGGIPPAFHDLRSPRYQNCTICHTKVHGSYVNRTLLR